MEWQKIQNSEHKIEEEEQSLKTDTTQIQELLCHYSNQGSVILMRE